MQSRPYQYISLIVILLFVGSMAGLTVYGQYCPRWEYRAIALSELGMEVTPRGYRLQAEVMQAKFDELGNQGWELVQVIELSRHGGSMEVSSTTNERFSLGSSFALLKRRR